jgi:hypothetical protein
MGFSEITKKLTGVAKSQSAGQEVRRELVDRALDANLDGDFMLEERLITCSKCEYLKEELKVFGMTIKDKTPTCGECGCNLNLKTKLDVFHCPKGLW